MLLGRETRNGVVRVQSDVHVVIAKLDCKLDVAGGPSLPFTPPGLARLRLHLHPANDRNATRATVAFSVIKCRVLWSSERWHISVIHVEGRRIISYIQVSNIHIIRRKRARITYTTQLYTMAPIAIDRAPIESSITDVAQPKKDTLGLPPTTRARLEKAGIDLTDGYPYRPARPLYLQDAYAIRNEPWQHKDAGARADKSKKALFDAATKVTHLTGHIGTEIEGLQLKDLTNQQRDELALLIAERSVVFFRDQDISPQQQKELGEYYGKVEIHPQTPQVPGVPGVTVSRELTHHVVPRCLQREGHLARAPSLRKGRPPD